ncbi:MAG: polysaccharide biosynthesis protein [Clostridia bacterium]|nr:polysaccharide biosynthesis protein [Clostridia bacterium]
MSLNPLRRKRTRKALLILFDIFCFIAIDAVYYLSTVFLDKSLKYEEPNLFLLNSAILLGVILAVRMIAGIYFNVWRYTNTTIYMKMIVSDGVSCLVALGLTFAFGTDNGIWHFLTVSAFNALLVLMSRFAYRQLYKHIKRSEENERHKIPVAIVGAGQIGALLAEELTYSKKSNYKPIFFIDKDPSKVGSRVAGLKVYREDDRLLDFIQSQEVSEIFVALPKLTSEEASKVYEFYSQTNCKVKLYDTPMKDAQESPRVRQARLREFQIEDLLFRKSLQINNSDSFRYYNGKVVLVTGGGGSIGSELCRQLAKCNPSKLIILDIYENNAYDIQQELLRTYGKNLDLVVEIASVRDRKRLESVFNAYRPNIVFHAAAHKHVPLMEHSGCEAIKNNIIGTYNTADMAEKYGVEKFILISTDKAVNPTNIMGASKRMCEMIVQCRGDSQTSFASVRFGNVLGSNGSVIPLFKRQIANGGPVTITDKRIIRYFMTIPEASQLVIQAGAMAKKGELFVLDMGKPVRIYDLARNMIKLSGLEPDVDIKIEEIGLRPGEKLYEELLIKTETLTKTENDMIFIEKDSSLTRAEVDEKIDILLTAVRESENEIASEKIKDALKRAVPTFHSPNLVNRKAEQSEEMKEVDAAQKQEIPTT